MRAAKLKTQTKAQAKWVNRTQPNQYCWYASGAYKARIGAPIDIRPGKKIATGIVIHAIESKPRGA